MQSIKNVNGIKNKMTAFQNNFAKRLSELRKAKGVSKTAVARAIQVDPSYISKLEAGAKVNVSLEVMEKIASFFDVDREWIVNGVTHQDATPKNLPNEEIEENIRQGPSGAAVRMEWAELVADIADYARRIEAEKPIMQRAMGEIIAAFALELARRPLPTAPKIIKTGADTPPE